MLHSSDSRPATSPASCNDGHSKKTINSGDSKSKQSLIQSNSLNIKSTSTHSKQSITQNHSTQAKTTWEEYSKKVPQSYKRTSALISEFHTLQKALARTKDPIQRQQILKQQARLGGLKTYQAASSYAGSKEKGGETGKWCAKALENHLGGKKNITLLDVGAISGTSYEKFPWIQTTSIDLNPQDPSKVLKYDFMKFPIPEEKFDVIGLSLVLNFVGDLKQRSEMIKHSHQYLKPFGFLYIVLPLACIENSRYLDSNRFNSILNSLGFHSLQQYNSSKLTFWLTQRSGQNGIGSIQRNLKWSKEEIRNGIDRNNFCIKV
ncbi:putative methyltransferase-domain-containing protein [Melampsora americana]|nr:putative methyltransferase-domain-containing protein [Melampsora americana]